MPKSAQDERNPFQMSGAPSLMLSSRSGGVTAFATAAKLAAQPGGRELLASHVSPIWDDASRHDDRKAHRRKASKVGLDKGYATSSPPLTSPPRHLKHSGQPYATSPPPLTSPPGHPKHSGQPTSYSKIHLEMKGRKHAEQNMPPQELKLKQLRDIMHSVYSAKRIADDEAGENNDPRGTMSNFMSGYLRSKYGSRMASEEWLCTVKNGIEKYSSRDLEIKAFGKILQNELPETFPEVQEQLGKSILSILRRNLEEAHPSMSQSDVSAIWSSWQRQGVPFAPACEVVKFLYSSEDRQDILEDLRELSGKPLPAGPLEEPIKKDCIHMKGFLHVLNRFQMDLADRYLTDFIRMFREVDVDGDGTLTGPSLQDLVRRLGRLPEGVLGTHSEFLVDEARVAVHAATKHVRSCTFSEAVDLCKNLITAREKAMH